MLKSTYKPSANLPPPLPPGWTEHKAPTGHTYYYNESTKESTYKRPGAIAPPLPPTGPQVPPGPGHHQDANRNFYQYSSVPNLSDPAAANAFLAQYDPARQRQNQQHGGRGGSHRGGRGGGRDGRPRPQPNDKPRSKVAIPGCEPWILVYTKYGRRFAYNPVKNASYWRIPEKVMQGVLDLDIKGIQSKAGDKKEEESEANKDPQDAEGAEPEEEIEEDVEEEQEELGSDYEEVEVTDDEDEEGQSEDGEGQPSSKRQRTEEPAEELPAEFDEDDIAYQLQAMGQEYGLDPGEYDDGDPDAWPEGAEGIGLSDEDARELFKDLLNDYSINPYSPWEKLIEEGRLVEDPRYTALPNMKARRDVWEEWSRVRIQVLREQRAKEEKKDPRIPFLAFLQDKATPKLYWPEFKRKYKKENVMRDTSLADRDREKLYREHVGRLKMPADALKKDLTALLRSLPSRLLDRRTNPTTGLPAQLLSDMRYISLDPQTRDPLIEAYIQTLDPPADEDGQVADDDDEDEATQKARQARQKREQALAERERVVAEEKRRNQRQLAHGRAALREEERELERANQVGKRGLQSQLAGMAASSSAGEKGEEKKKE